MMSARNRHYSIIKALRKRRLDRAIYCAFDYRRRNLTDRDSAWYENLHQYSKNKIHCSCPMCSAKTRNKGGSKHKGMSPPLNYKISDVRKIQKLEYVDD